LGGSCIPTKMSKLKYYFTYNSASSFYSFIAWIYLSLIFLKLMILSIIILLFSKDDLMSLRKLLIKFFVNLFLLNFISQLLQNVFMICRDILYIIISQTYFSIYLTRLILITTIIWVLTLLQFLSILHKFLYFFGIFGI